MSYKHRHYFQPFLFLFCALILKATPIISIPFKWLESFFHELSHGLAAIATGGKIIQIQLFPNGAGLCTSLGGSEFIILFAGYSGAVFWGFLLYSLANIQQKYSKALLYFLISIISLTVLLWVRDMLTLVLLLLLVGILSIFLKITRQNFTQYVLKIIGITVMLNAIYSPLFLLDGRAKGDGAALASLTFIPEIFWIGIWFIIAVSAILVVLFKRTKNNE